MADDEIRFLDTPEGLDEVLRMPAALLYKHSTRCGTSLRALIQVERFSRDRPEVPVFGIPTWRMHFTLAPPSNGPRARYLKPSKPRQ